MKCIYIPLTNRPPIGLPEEQWPITEYGRYRDITIRVRQHKDGRAIVYAVYDPDESYSGGILLPPPTATSQRQSIQ